MCQQLMSSCTSLLAALTSASSCHSLFLSHYYFNKVQSGRAGGSFEHTQWIIHRMFHFHKLTVIQNYLGHSLSLLEFYLFFRTATIEYCLWYCNLNCIQQRFESSLSGTAVRVRAQMTMLTVTLQFSDYLPLPVSFPDVELKQKPTTWNSSNNTRG